MFSRLRAALERAKINVGGGSGGVPDWARDRYLQANPRGTLLYDAFIWPRTMSLRHEVGRKAMILLTDGEDQGSQLKIKDAIEAAQKSDAIVLRASDRRPRILRLRRLFRRLAR